MVHAFGQDCMKDSLREWWQKNKDRLLIFLLLVLVGALCFEAGLLQSSMRQAAPLVLSIPAPPQKEPPAAVILSLTENPVSEKVEQVVAGVAQPGCVFVGSKNSNKYHLPSCAVAKRIKVENRVCFASKEEAEKRGYVPSCIQ